MDLTTILPYVAFVLETAVLIGAMLFLTKAIKADKNSPEKSKNMKVAMVFIIVYLMLKMLGSSGFGL